MQTGIEHGWMYNRDELSWNHGMESSGERLLKDKLCISRLNSPPVKLAVLPSRENFIPHFSIELTVYRAIVYWR